MENDVDVKAYMGLGKNHLKQNRKLAAKLKSTKPKNLTSRRSF